MGNDPVIRIREINRVEELLGLEAAWDELLERSAANSVFLTWEYMRTWWEVYSGWEAELHVLLAESDDGRLLGLAPLMIAPGMAPAREAFRHLGLLGGDGDSLAEYLDLIVEAGSEAPVAREFARYVAGELGATWDVLRIGMVAEDARALGAFLEELQELGMEIRCLGTHTAPSLGLPESWDEFLASRSQNFRRGIRVAWRKLGEGRSVTTRTVECREDLDAAMEALSELNRKRWGDEGLAFQSSAFEVFHRRLAERFLERGWLFLSYVEADGRTVGARYDFVFGGKMWCFQGGWDPELAGIGIGKAMLSAAVEWAIGQGLREYDFLAGDARYKREWSSTQRTLKDYQGINPATVRGKVFEVLSAAKRGLEEWTGRRRRGAA